MVFHEKLGAVPPVPSSLNPNDWRTIPIHNDPSSSSSVQLPDHVNTAPSITPYLGLRARLSQLWFNRWTVLLILVLVRVLLLSGSLDDNIADAKVKALSACSKVEDIGSAMASMPHYLSVGVNSLASEGITKAVSGLVKVLIMILTGVENLLFFIINMYVGTFVCVVTALIHGGLDVAVKVIEGATKLMNNAVSGLTSQIEKIIDPAENFLESIESTKVLGKSVKDWLDLDMPDLSTVKKPLADLKNIKISSDDLVKDIKTLNQKIPTFDQIENLTKDAIAIPFDTLKKQINSTFGNYKFDDSVFPVAQKKALSFCSDNTFLNDFFDSLAEIVAKAKIAFLVIVPLLAVAAIVAMGWLEIRRWRRQMERAKGLSEHVYDPMDAVYMISRPMTSRFGIRIASFITSKRKYIILIRWAWAYTTSLPALFVLSLALAGFFSCFCQYIILQLLQKEVPALSTKVGDFTGQVVTTLQRVSTDWSNEANGVILKLQDDINNDLFGWVQEATSAVNNTLTTFDNEIDKGLNSAFKDTVLLQTAKDLVGCLIGRKIDAVQKGLTWVHDHAHVTLPLFAEDVFSRGANDSVSGDSDLTSFLASPSTVTTDEITAAVNRVIDKLRQSIVEEALISTALLLVYIIVVLIGILWAMANAVKRDKTRGEGGQEYGLKDVGASDSDGNSMSTSGWTPGAGYYAHAGSVKSGRSESARWPSLAQKNGHPEVQDSDR